MYNRKYLPLGKGWSLAAQMERLNHHIHFYVNHKNHSCGTEIQKQQLWQIHLSYSFQGSVDSIAVSVFILFWLSLTNTEWETNPKNNLMMRRHVLDIIWGMSGTTSRAHCQQWRSICGATCICDAVFMNNTFNKTIKDGDIAPWKDF